MTNEEEDWTDAEFDEKPPPPEVQKRRGGYQGGPPTADEIEAYIKDFLTDPKPTKRAK
jgi:hypothetical protein